MYKVLVYPVDAQVMHK